VAAIAIGEGEKMTRVSLYFLFFFLSLPAFADQVSVAVASNFRDAAKLLADRFETRTGHIVQLSAASTGKHYAQIVHGAPFDAFLSADTRHPALLEQQGLAVAGSRFIYARGRITLWAPGVADEDCKAALEAGAYRRLSIANPKTAPYGVAAEQTLAALGLTQAYAAKIVMGENISQALQFVHAGAADAGFVATSQWLLNLRRDEGCHWEVPAALITPLDQEAQLLKRGEASAAAKAFLDFIRTPEAMGIIRQSGYDVAN
jgi:molybdate transport system substrate-binding protein